MSEAVRRPLLARLGQAMVDSAYRESLWSRLGKRGMFQPNTDTGPNRYPRIFRFVQEELGVQCMGPIVSFGCSTGDEVFTLRRYFPDAAIKGVDINTACLAECRRRAAAAGDSGMTFTRADSLAGEPDGGCAAIFCMAVLRNGQLGAPGITRCDSHIRFADFARAIEDFRRCLAPGGLLAIRFSNFRLCDTPAGRAFETVFSAPHRRPGSIPIFGPDERLIPGADYPDSVFRKISAGTL